MIKAYYTLTKPGIIYGNAIAAIAGFFFAANGTFNGVLFLGMLLGVSLVMASACVFNNYIDRDIDAKMKRTKQRVLVRDVISPQSALVYGFVLGLLGFAALYIITNPLTTAIAAFGFIIYVAVYGYLKRVSPVGTLVGSLAGAVPPVVGYCAVVNRVDAGAVLLFLALAIWQMPHSYAIALFRADDYAAADIPVLPAVRGEHVAKVHMAVYSLVFIFVMAAFVQLGLKGLGFLFFMLPVSFYWFIVAVRGMRESATQVWARTYFRLSLVVLLAFCLVIAIPGM